MAAPQGFLRTIKTTARDALKSAFVIAYPETDPQGGTQPVYCSLDYPVNPAAIPSVWVDFETTDLHIAGIDYTEMQPAESDSQGNLVTRWIFQGNASFTIVAMTNNERDLIFDELVSVIAFAAQSEHPNSFRNFVEQGDLIASTWSFDKIEMRGGGAAQGTPWLSDEVIYEQGLAIAVRGEFVSSPVTMALVPLREIVITATSSADGAQETGVVTTSSSVAGSPVDQQIGRFGL